MNYTNEIFKRADIQQIRSFLIYGDECKIERGTYEERIEKAVRKLSARIHAEFPDDDSYEDIMSLIYCYASVVEDVYMEMGLIVGGFLSAQACRTYAMHLQE